MKRKPDNRVVRSEGKESRCKDKLSNPCPYVANLKRPQMHPALAQYEMQPKSFFILASIY